MTRHLNDLGYATTDIRWTKPRSLMGCPRPSSRHHHHFYRGHLETATCSCHRGGEPGSVGPVLR